MKNKIFRPVFILVLFACFACEEEGEKAIIKSTVTPNAIQDLSGSSFTFLFEDSGENFETVSWTELDYGFPASISSTLEMAKAGENFANAVALTTT